MTNHRLRRVVTLLGPQDEAIVGRDDLADGRIYGLHAGPLRLLLHRLAEVEAVDLPDAGVVLDRRRQGNLAAGDVLFR